MNANELAEAFHGTLVTRDWPALRNLFHDDATC